MNYAADDHQLAQVHPQDAVTQAVLGEFTQATAGRLARDRPRRTRS
ncbi:hypothetical protein ACFC5Z_29980 [Streptomyces sp. NPDC056004]